MKKRTLFKVKILIATFICWLSANSIANQDLTMIWSTKEVSSWTVKNHQTTQFFISGEQADINYVLEKRKLKISMNWVDEVSHKIEVDVRLSDTEWQDGYIKLTNQNLKISPKLDTEFWAELWFDVTTKGLNGDLLLEAKTGTNATRIKFKAIY